MNNMLLTVQQKVPHLGDVFELILSSQPFIDSSFVDSVERYCGFLFLVSQYPHLTLVPTLEIDSILHTHLAQSNCQQELHQLFGEAELIHASGMAQSASFQSTKTLFEQEFDCSYGWQAAACDVFLKR